MGRAIAPIRTPGYATVLISQHSQHQIFEMSNEVILLQCSQLIRARKISLFELEFL